MPNLNDLPNELIYEILSQLNKRKHLAAIRFLNRKFYEMSQEIYPTVSLSGLSTTVITELSDYLQDNFWFVLKIKHVALINNIIPNNEGYLPTGLNTLFNYLNSVKGVELNLVHNNGGHMVNGLIEGILTLSSL